MLTLTNAHGRDSDNSAQSRLTSSYEPLTETTSPPKTVVPAILPASRSSGMNTTLRMPDAAEWAATALARLPVEAHAATSKPNDLATLSAIVTTRSLNEWVGLPPSFLIQSLRSPSSAASLGACLNLVHPVPMSMRPLSGAGSRAAYRHIVWGPCAMESLVISAAMAS